MRKILLIVIGVIGMFLTACDDDKEVSLSDIPIRLSGKILGMDEGEVLTRFRGGAGVGVYIVDASERQTGDLLGARVTRSLCKVLMVWLVIRLFAGTGRPE